MQSLEARNASNRYFLEPQEECSSADTLILVQWNPLWTSDVQNYMIINKFVLF